MYYFSSVLFFLNSTINFPHVGFNLHSSTCSINSQYPISPWTHQIQSFQTSNHKPIFFKQWIPLLFHQPTSSNTPKSPSQKQSNETEQPPKPSTNPSPPAVLMLSPSSSLQTWSGGSMARHIASTWCVS